MYVNVLETNNNTVIVRDVVAEKILMLPMGSWLTKVK